MPRFHIAPLTLLALSACNTEKAYQDLIQNHGVTWDTTMMTTSAGPEQSESTASTVPTTSHSGGASDGLSGATSGTTGFGDETTTGAQLDMPPMLEFSVTPEDVESAMFVELAASCVDDAGVVEVRFFVDDAPLATVTAPPFAAQWPVKSTDDDGPRTVRAECKDTAGHVATEERLVDVTLPGSNAIAWADLHPSANWSTEALDASPAPDGSWWVCGYDTNGDGGGSMWVAHYSAGGALLFDKLIARGPNFFGTCNGIETFPDDPHRAALTGAWIKDGLSPTLWVGVVDETQQDYLIAKHEDDFLGEVGNDVAVTTNHQIRVTGYKMIANNDHDLTYHAMTVVEGEQQLGYAGGDLYTSKSGWDLKVDVGETIVVLPDGRSLIAGRTVSPQHGRSRGLVALVGTNHQIIETTKWPFVSSLPEFQHEGFNDLTVTADGLVAAAGWWRSEIDTPARLRLIHFELADPAETQGTFTQPEPGGELVGRSLSRLSTGSVMVAASKADLVEKDDIWLRKYAATDWTYAPEPEWPQTHAGYFHGNDVPHAIRVNDLDQFLVVGFETIQVLKDGNIVNVRQAWLRAFHG